MKSAVELVGRSYTQFGESIVSETDKEVERLEQSLLASVEPRRKQCHIVLAQLASVSVEARRIWQRHGSSGPEAYRDAVRIYHDRLAGVMYQMGRTRHANALELANQVDRAWSEIARPPVEEIVADLTAVHGALAAVFTIIPNDLDPLAVEIAQLRIAASTDPLGFHAALQRVELDFVAAAGLVARQRFLEFVIAVSLALFGVAAGGVVFFLRKSDRIEEHSLEQG